MPSPLDKFKEMPMNKKIAIGVSVLFIPLIIFFLRMTNANNVQTNEKDEIEVAQDVDIEGVEVQETHKSSLQALKDRASDNRKRNEVKKRESFSEDDEYGFTLYDDEEVEEEVVEEVVEDKQTVSKSKNYNGPKVVYVKTKPQVEEEEKPRRRVLSDKDMFYGSETNTSTKVDNNSLVVIFHGNQTLGQGSRAKLRVIKDGHINNMLVKKNTYIYGTTTLTNNKVLVKVTSISFSNGNQSVKMEIEDEGDPGINVPNGIVNEAIKETATDGVGGGGLSFNLPIGLGISTNGLKRSAEEMLQKATVEIPSGKEVLLVDQNK